MACELWWDFRIRVEGGMRGIGRESSNTRGSWEHEGGAAVGRLGYQVIMTTQ